MKNIHNDRGLLINLIFSESTSADVIGFTANGSGGLFVKTKNGLDGFIPSSGLKSTGQGNNPITATEMEQLVGKTIEAAVLFIDFQTGILRLSPRLLQNRRWFTANAKVGMTRRGKIVDIIVEGTMQLCTVEVQGICGVMDVETEQQPLCKGQMVEVQVLELDDEVKFAFQHVLENSNHNHIDRRTGVGIGDKLEVRFVEFKRFGIVVTQKDGARRHIFWGNLKNMDKGVLNNLKPGDVLNARVKSISNGQSMLEIPAPDAAQVQDVQNT